MSSGVYSFSTAVLSPRMTDAIHIHAAPCWTFSRQKRMFEIMPTVLIQSLFGYDEVETLERFKILESYIGYYRKCIIVIVHQYCIVIS